MKLFKGNRHARWREQASAYLDGRLSPGEGDAFEAHLRECDACTREVEELRKVAALLQRVPQVAVPRSFTLQRAPDRRPGWLLRYTTPLRYAAATTAFLFVIAVAGDLAVTGPSRPEAAPAGIERTPRDGASAAAGLDGKKLASTPSSAAEQESIDTSASDEASATPEASVRGPDEKQLAAGVPPTDDRRLILLRWVEGVLGLLALGLAFLAVAQWRVKRRLRL